MSVIIATKVSGDTSVFAKSLEERADEYRQWGSAAGLLGPSTISSRSATGLSS
ncbi:hypothetical protein AHiyo8_07080 [Arthrobacter sp. Hiyo8]|nr:hypothetical protein AHiyo8_07080 [Arthrobacter sp. Hiyo8]